MIKFKNVKSTNDEAIKLIKSNKTKPTIIHSYNQSKGRGTMGKKWISKKGNIFLSIFFGNGVNYFVNLKLIKNGQILRYMQN